MPSKIEIHATLRITTEKLYAQMGRDMSVTMILSKVKEDLMLGAGFFFHQGELKQEFKGAILSWAKELFDEENLREARKNELDPREGMEDKSFIEISDDSPDPSDTIKEFVTHTNKSAGNKYGINILVSTDLRSPEVYIGKPTGITKTYQLCRDATQTGRKSRDVRRRRTITRRVFEPTVARMSAPSARARV